jgi:hypothetical protein
LRRLFGTLRGVISWFVKKIKKEKPLKINGLQLICLGLCVLFITNQLLYQLSYTGAIPLEPQRLFQAVQLIF